jgi:carbon monoxide dehydrogenase subunit G
MPVLREVIEVTAPIEGAFAYVADFSDAEDWDPGVISSTQVGEPTPPRVGTAYDVVVSFRGKQQTMRYVIAELDPPRRVVLRGTGKTVEAVDTVSFEALPSGTRITYEADLRLTGVAKLATPFLGRAFGEMAAKALAGLKRRLDAHTVA